MDDPNLVIFAAAKKEFVDGELAAGRHIMMVSMMTKDGQLHGVDLRIEDADLLLNAQAFSDRLMVPSIQSLLNQVTNEIPGI